MDTIVTIVAIDSTIVGGPIVVTMDTIVTIVAIDSTIVVTMDTIFSS